MGSTVKELLRKDPTTSHFWQGRIASDPTDLSDKVYVIVPGFDSNVRWGPCRWQARDLTSLPSRGDHCLVALDDRGEAWVVSWWPYAT